MPELFLRETAEAREHPLSEGVALAGRRPGHDICLQDPSVSGVHAELIFDGNTLTVRDLGSTNGTFLDDERVMEANVRPGQRLRFGQVELMVMERRPEPEEPPASRSGLKVVRSNAVAAAVMTKTALPLPIIESVNPAQGLFCHHCNETVDRSLAKTFKSGRKVHYFCPRCGGGCHSLEGGQKEERAQPSFVAGLLSSFRYPLSAEGLILLAAGTFFFGALHLASFISQFAGIIGWVSLLFLTIFGTGYLFAFLKSVVASSAYGENHMPQWPEFSDIGSDIIGPFLQFLGIFVLSFGPALAWLIFGPDSLKLPVTIGLVFFGLIYLPMAMVAVSLYDSLAGMHPLLITTSILRIGWHYLVVIGFLILVLVLRFAALAMAERVSIPVIPFLLTEFLSLYFLVVIMRMLGLMYFANERRLGWFRKVRA
jgi:pSer/pThr/pTyr-binding forkhead associated (FHA) protein